MSIDVRSATESDRGRWNDYLERSPQGTFFHEYEVLEVQAEHADATLYPLIGYKGQEPVGLFPVFEIRKGIVTTAFSPPPLLRVPYLGPALLNMGKLKRRKRDRRLRQFVDECTGWVEAEIAPTYESVRTGPAFGDPRPFRWAEYDVTSEHTYVVDLATDADELLATFSRDARTNVTKTPDDRYRIEEGGPDAIRDVVEQVSRRYESQGLDFHLSDAFAIDCYERAANGAVRPYTLRVDGAFVGGIVAVEHGDTVFRWLGGVRTDDVDLPTNDLLDWAVMRDGLERGVSAYDLVGAETPQINRYKAKFDPSLRTHYSFERGRWGMRKLAHLYRSIK